MESLNDILEYTESPSKPEVGVEDEIRPKNEVKSEPSLTQNDKSITSINRIDTKAFVKADKHEVMKLIKIYLKEFPEETKEWTKKAKDMDSLDDTQLEELKINVIRSVNSVSSLDTIADNSVLVLNLYEYLMEPIFPVPGISASLGKNPAFKGTVKKILLKYLGTSLYTEMSPEFSLVAMVFQSSILCNAVADVNSKKIQAKNEEVCESVVKNVPPAFPERLSKGRREENQRAEEISHTEDNFDDL